LLLALTSADIFGLRGSARYALDMGLLLVWLFGWILALNAGSRELPQEESRGTIYLLLAKPVRRGELLVGKWLGAWSGVVTAVLLFYLVTWLIVASQGVVVPAGLLAQTFLLHACALGIITALALLCATRLNRDAAATLAGVVTATALLLVPRIPTLALQGDAHRAVILRALYHVLPHFELFDLRRRLVHDFGPLDAMTFLTIAAYGCALIALLLLGAWLAYRNKRFVRDRLSD
jgi:ABC-type transport system involved in multi-copper enzyme maturation permease subunit